VCGGVFVFLKYPQEIAISPIAHGKQTCGFSISLVCATSILLLLLPLLLLLQPRT
jgi:hypothetical protein